jgi:hypothetical protein
MRLPHEESGYAIASPKGIQIVRMDFASGPPLLEALNAASVDIGRTGDSPPLFAQAAGSLRQGRRRSHLGVALSGGYLPPAGLGEEKHRWWIQW